MNDNINLICITDENNEKNIKILQTKINKLKEKQKNYAELDDFSKRLYSSSVPVILLFNVFIEVMVNSDFNLINYLLLNGITLPSTYLINTFICGTSIGRKRKIANINGKIEDTETEIMLLSKQIDKSKMSEIIKTNIVSKIKPIDRTQETTFDKPYVRTLIKK